MSLTFQKMLDPNAVHDIMAGVDMDHIGAEVDTSRTLASGFKPLHARDTPNGLSLFIDAPDEHLVGTGWIVTGWDGEPLPQRLAIRTLPAHSVGDAVNKVIKLWAGLLQAMRTGTQSDLPELIRELSPRAAALDTIDPLRVGEHVAYLLPDIPPFVQANFITTQVVGVHPLQLANNHHQTIFAQGRGEIARYNPLTDRVVFPLVQWRVVV
jgi:hypothetical protein